MNASKTWEKSFNEKDFRAIKTINCLSCNVIDGYCKRNKKPVGQECCEKCQRIASQTGCAGCATATVSLNKTKRINAAVTMMECQNCKRAARTREVRKQSVVEASYKGQGGTPACSEAIVRKRVLIVGKIELAESYAAKLITPMPVEERCSMILEVAAKNIGAVIDIYIKAAGRKKYKWNADDVDSIFDFPETHRKKLLEDLPQNETGEYFRQKILPPPADDVPVTDADTSADLGGGGEPRSDEPDGGGSESRGTKRPHNSLDADISADENSADDDISDEEGEGDARTDESWSMVLKRRCPADLPDQTYVCLGGPKREMIITIFNVQEHKDCPDSVFMIHDPTQMGHYDTCFQCGMRFSTQDVRVKCPGSIDFRTKKVQVCDREMHQQCRFISKRANSNSDEMISAADQCHGCVLKQGMQMNLYMKKKTAGTGGLNLAQCLQNLKISQQCCIMCLQEVKNVKDLHVEPSDLASGRLHQCDFWGKETVCRKHANFLLIRIVVGLWHMQKKDDHRRRLLASLKNISDAMLEKARAKLQAILPDKEKQLQEQSHDLLPFCVDGEMVIVNVTSMNTIMGWGPRSRTVDQFIEGCVRRADRPKKTDINVQERYEEEEALRAPFEAIHDACCFACCCNAIDKTIAEEVRKNISENGAALLMSIFKDIHGRGSILEQLWHRIHYDFLYEVSERLGKGQHCHSTRGNFMRLVEQGTLVSIKKFLDPEQQGEEVAKLHQEMVDVYRTITSVMYEQQRPCEVCKQQEGTSIRCLTCSGWFCCRAHHTCIPETVMWDGDKFYCRKECFDNRDKAEVIKRSAKNDDAADSADSDSGSDVSMSDSSGNGSSSGSEWSRDSSPESSGAEGY